MKLFSDSFRCQIALLSRAISLVLFFITCHICTILFKIKLYLYNIQFGHNITAGGGAIPMLRISPHAKLIRIGDNVAFNNYNDAGWNSKCSIWVKQGAELLIGNNSGFNGVLIYANTSIIIGDNVKVGGGTRIFDTDFHPLDYRERRNSIAGTNSCPIKIEDDVFIGSSCIILKGTSIGARSIVAAGSVVTCDIPKDEIWGGNPAKFLRKNETL